MCAYVLAAETEGEMPHDLRLREICTDLALGGKTLKEVGFPNEWEYDPVLQGYEKDGYDSECNGEKTREKFFLSYQKIHLMKRRRRMK